MRKLYAKATAIALLALQITWIAAAQSNCSTSITLSTQAQVDAFATNYGCSQISGNLLISGTDITNLDGLSSVARVDGGLRIFDNPNLTSISGLSSLTYVGTGNGGGLDPGMQIINNTKLGSLDGFQNLKQIRGMLRIENNGSLVNIDGLSAVTSIGTGNPSPGSVVISDNPTLTSLAGFRSITSLPGPMSIYNNDALQNLTGFDGLTEIYNGIDIIENQSLSSLQGFNALHRIIGGALRIISNQSLVNVDALGALTGMSGGSSTAIWIISNASLQNVDGFSHLSTDLAPMAHLRVTDNPNLTNGCGLYPLLTTTRLGSVDAEIHDNGPGVTKEGILATCGPQTTCSGSITLRTQAEVDAFPTTYGCAQISGSLSITGVDITNLGGLHSITTISGSLTISNNPNLISMTGLSSLSLVGGSSENSYASLVITYNAKLTNIDGLEKLAEIKGLLKIENNDRLVNLNALSALSSVGAPEPTGQSISIRSNPALSSLAGLRSIANLPGGLWITSNNALQNLAGLDALTSVGTYGRGQLIIDGNQSLSSLQGLNALQSIAGRNASLAIENNPNLTNVDAMVALTRISGTPEAYLRIVNNAALQNVNGLSNLTSMRPEGYITVTDNHNLTNGCGLYPLLNNGYEPASAVNIANNGPGVTREGILATCGPQTNCNGDIMLTTQAEVNAYPTTHGCKEIAGSLTITGVDITNLNALSSITRIEGNLIIANNPNLENVDGLIFLTYVGAGAGPEPGLHISNNPKLVYLQLANLKQIAGLLRIENNNSLYSTDDLSSLTSLGAPFPTGLSVSISGNPALVSLAGFRKVTVFPGSVSINDNDALQDLTGFNALTQIGNAGGGSLSITGNQTLTSLQGLNALHSVGGRGAGIFINDNPNLLNVDALGALTSLGGTPDVTIWIINNASLQNVNGFSKITSLGPAGHLKVTDNHNLTNGCGFYPLLSTYHLETMEVEIHDNGPGVTREGILATCGPQTTCSGGITLTTQAEVDAFPTTLGCAEIAGSLTISGADIANLDGLHSVTRVEGNLKIIDNPNLSDVSGLSSLTYIGGRDSDSWTYPGLWITNNSKLPNLDGFEKLKEVHGLLKLENNTSLANIDGLSTLASVQGPFPSGISVSIVDNPALASLSGLRSLTTIPGGLYIINNGSLQNLTGLDQVTHAGGAINDRFEIRGNQSLTSLQGLNALQTVGGRYAFVIIADNPKLTNVDALASLTSIYGAPDAGISVVNNASLQNLDGLSHLADVGAAGGVRVTDNPNLTDGCGLYSILSGPNVSHITFNISNNGPGVTREGILANCGPQTSCNGDIALSTQAEVDGFPATHGCTEITGTLTISGTDITNLNGLHSITRITGDLRITDNPNLASVSGLSSLTYVGGTGSGGPYPGLWVVNNAKLHDLNGLENLTDLSGLLRIENNAGLVNFDALSGLAGIGAPFPSGTCAFIVNNPALESLAGFRSITVFGGSIWIENNDALVNLNGLDKVTKVGGGEGARLQIKGNQSLSSLQGLNALKTIGGRNTFLEIVDNPNITNIDALSSLTEMFGSPDVVISVSSNASLQNLNGLSHLTSFGARGHVEVVGNRNLTDGCGLYPILSTQVPASQVQISDNGPGVTREGILANCAPQNPGPQPTAMVFSNVTDEGMTVSFTAASPAPKGYITLMRAWGSPYPKDAPVDGVEYHVGNVIGHSTIVVGIGAQVSLNIVYLEPNTPYYFDVFSYGEGFDYVTENPLAGSQRTSSPSLFEQPVNLRFSNITENSMTVAFDAPAHEPQGYITLMRAYGSPSPADNPVNGTTYHVGDVIGASTIVVGYGTQTSLEIVYLEPSTPYYYDVLSYRSRASGPEYLLDSPLAGNQRTLDPQPAAYPNPFVEVLNIPFVVSDETTNVQVAIFDTMGNPIVELVNKSYGSGKHNLVWDRSDAKGSRVVEGLYVYRVKIGGANRSKGIIVAK